ncbi:hypothetical protein SLE2022_009040 [Rubroshorea leprosula]
MQSQVLSTRDADLATAKEEISCLESEFSSYKICTHALLQKKEAELMAATDSEQIKSLEEALKAEKEALAVSAERDKAQQELKDALATHKMKHLIVTSSRSRA